MNRYAVFTSASDLQLLTLCIYGEARGEGLDGMLAVASVVMNRVRDPRDNWWGNDVAGVVLKDAQFSCFNEKDMNREVLAAMIKEYGAYLRTNPVLRAAEWIARGVLEGKLYSNVGSATHYHHYRSHPSWIKSMEKLITIGQHVFYAEKT